MYKTGYMTGNGHPSESFLTCLFKRGLLVKPAPASGLLVLCLGAGRGSNRRDLFPLGSGALFSMISVHWCSPMCPLFP